MVCSGCIQGRGWVDQNAFRGGWGTFQITSRPNVADQFEIHSGLGEVQLKMYSVVGVAQVQPGVGGWSNF